MTLLERHGDDPIAVDAALSGLRGNEGAALEKLLQAEGPQTPQRDAAVTMVAATLVRGGQDAAIQALFAWVADEGRVPWQRAALMRGAEVAVLGAPMPGGVEWPSRRDAAGTGAVSDLPGRTRWPRRSVRLSAGASAATGPARRPFESRA